LIPDKLTRGPVAPAERLGAIDTLRGLALFGVLVINLETEFRVSIFQQLLPGPPIHGLERMISAALEILVDFKAFALFSLLFGVGLAIQFDRLAWTSARLVLLVRRLIVLLGFGLIHLTLIWNGDILTEYALAGLVVLPFLFAAPRAVAIGAGAFLGLYVFNPWLPVLTPLPGGTWLQDQIVLAAQAYGHGAYVEGLAQRLRELPGIFSLEAFVFARTVGLMLLGVLAWRMGVAAGVARRAPAVAASGTGLVIVGLVLSLASTARGYLGWPDLGRVGTMAEHASAIVLALGYAALVLAACSSKTGAVLLGWAGPLGRMAFSNYIAQSLILGWVFYGYGLGLFNRLSLAQGLILTVVLYAGQVVTSGMWLRLFRYGPLEWQWRAVMYGRMDWPERAARRTVGPESRALGGSG
jgi:uncharacterized protein